MVGNPLIFQVLALVALQGISMAVDPLSAFYPDVTNCYKGIARENEKEAVERNQDGKEACKGQFNDESSICFKACILQDEYMMFRLDHPESVLPKNLGREAEEEFYNKMEEERIGTNYTVTPGTTAFQLCHFMGISINVITESYNPEFQRLIDELGKCQPLSEQTL
ncbi:hypothetical protein Ocin01_16885 [Orchesella cincta]|uniref:Uncharacterized protein n=1 Tax=Orchesella cincta TaxID=48709 RepID=A0A1D2M9Y8_ORCCI|nr:hypothetical protein Ocin01_16885 [Orchesella cincta]